MRKKSFFEFALIFCVALCTVFIFGIYAGAVDIAKPSPNANQPDAFSIEELNIIPNYAILEGQTLQMQVEEFDEFVLFDSVEWTSSIKPLESILIVMLKQNIMVHIGMEMIK